MTGKGIGWTFIIAGLLFMLAALLTSCGTVRNGDGLLPSKPKQCHRRCGTIYEWRDGVRRPVHVP